MVRNCVGVLRENRSKVLPMVIFAVLVIAAAAIYINFFFTQSCQNFECFMIKMQNCNKGYTYFNDDKQATWQYRIDGTNNGLCAINVKMVNAKEGDLNLNSLIGFDMECSYALGYSNYPEKDLSKCHGRLKEELQGIIIQKLHAYIIENLGKIQTGLENV